MNHLPLLGVEFKHEIRQAPNYSMTSGNRETARRKIFGTLQDLQIFFKSFSAKGLLKSSVFPTRSERPKND